MSEKRSDPEARSSRSDCAKDASRPPANLSRGSSAHESVSTPYLTTFEAAQYLRLSERKLRGLVAERRVPFTRVPSGGRGGRGKLLFDRRELDLCVRRGFPKTRPASRRPRRMKRSPVARPHEGNS